MKKVFQILLVLVLTPKWGKAKPISFQEKTKSLRVQELKRLENKLLKNSTLGGLFQDIKMGLEKRDLKFLSQKNTKLKKTKYKIQLLGEFKYLLKIKKSAVTFGVKNIHNNEFLINNIIYKLDPEKSAWQIWKDVEKRLPRSLAHQRSSPWSLVSQAQARMKPSTAGLITSLAVLILSKYKGYVNKDSNCANIRMVNVDCKSISELEEGSRAVRAQVLIERGHELHNLGMGCESELKEMLSCTTELYNKYGEELKKELVDSVNEFYGSRDPSTRPYFQQSPHEMNRESEGGL